MRRVESRWTNTQTDLQLTHAEARTFQPSNERSTVECKAEALARPIRIRKHPRFHLSTLSSPPKAFQNLRVRDTNPLRHTRHTQKVDMTQNGALTHHTISY